LSFAVEKAYRRLTFPYSLAQLIQFFHNTERLVRRPGLGFCIIDVILLQQYLDRNFNAMLFFMYCNTLGYPKVKQPMEWQMIVHPFPNVSINFPTAVADGQGEPCRMTRTRRK